MQCLYPCRRPAPLCGHPVTHHTCHQNTVSCPPCPFLVTKICACGKKSVPNVRCSLETDKVSCGTVCGKYVRHFDFVSFIFNSFISFFLHRLMGCGFHHCERLCHSDECGNCSAPCGKARKSWCVLKQLTTKAILSHYFIAYQIFIPVLVPVTLPLPVPKPNPANHSLH